MKLALSLVPLLAALAAPGIAFADPVTVRSTDSVYNYSGAQVAGASSTTPPVLALADGTTALGFASTGSIYLTPGASPFGYHGPDGSPDAFMMNVTPAAGLSGIVSTNVGYVAGVFLGADGSVMPAVPATLDFSAGATGEGFASLSPLLDQVFFIGDGLTGTGTGAVQRFMVPAGATRLVLGIVDAYGYAGAPGAYYDNGGSFGVTVTAYTSAVPEPAAWTLMAAGLLLPGLALRRRRARGAPGGPVPVPA